MQLCTAAANLSTFATDASSKLDVFWHDGHSLGVNRAQVGVFEQSDQVSFAGLLQSHDSAALEAQIRLEVLSDFADQTLERQLADQQFSRLLVSTNFTQCNSAWSITMRLLDATSSRRAFTGCLGCQLFTRSLTSG